MNKPRKREKIKKQITIGTHNEVLIGKWAFNNGCNAVVDSFNSWFKSDEFREELEKVMDDILYHSINQKFVTAIAEKLGEK